MRLMIKLYCCVVQAIVPLLLLPNTWVFDLQALYSAKDSAKTNFRFHRAVNNHWTGLWTEQFDHKIQTCGLKLVLLYTVLPQGGLDKVNYC